MNKHSRWSWLGAVFLALAASSASSAEQMERRDVVSWPEWYLDKNLIDMTPESRFVSQINLQNPGKTPVYVRATVKRIALGDDGQRQITADETGTLRVFPEEMVLPPGGGFSARLIVDTTKLTADAQSYYVRFEDVSQLHLAEQSKSGALAAGFLLAYEAMVAVHRHPKNELNDKDIGFARNAKGQLALVNQSGQHIYLNRGYACPNNTQVLVECSEWPAFPRQTLLPGEAVPLGEPGTATAPAYLGLLAYPVLNSRRQPNRFYKPVPAVNAIAPKTH